MNPRSVGVSLELLAYGHSILSNNESGTDRPQILSCCRVGEIIDSRSAMNAGARHYQFSIEAPIHQPHAYEKGAMEIVSWEENRFRKKTAEMDAQTLLKKRTLQWVLHVELIGEDGVIRRYEKDLEVSD